MRKFILTAIGSSTARDTTSLFFGNMGSSVLAIVFTIVVARFLGPSDWGVAAGVISFVYIAIAVGDLGLGASLFRFASKAYSEGDLKEAKEVIRLAATLRAASAAILFILISTASFFLTEAVFKTNDPAVGVLAAAAVASYLLFDFGIISIQARKNFMLSAALLVLSNLLRVIFVAALWLGGALTLISTLIAYSTTPFIVFMLLFAFNQTPIGFPSDWRKRIAGLIPFSGSMGVNRVVGVLVGRLDILLVLTLLSAYDTGIFAAAKQLALGVPLVIGSFATVLAPRFASLKGIALRAYFFKSVLLSVIISGGVLFGVIISPLVINLFGTSYTESLAVLQLLLIGLIPFALATPAVNLLIYAFGKPWLVVFIAIVQAIIVLVGNITLLPVYGVMGAVYIQGFINLLLFVLSYTFVLWGFKKWN